MASSLCAKSRATPGGGELDGDRLKLLPDGAFHTSLKPASTRRIRGLVSGFARGHPTTRHQPIGRGTGEMKRSWWTAGNPPTGAVAYRLPGISPRIMPPMSIFW
jgi:hypothetical protein